MSYQFFKDFSSENLIKIDQSKSKPNKSDIRQVKKILDDFGINCKIPEFNTIRELQRWMRGTINNRLSE